MIEALLPAVDEVVVALAPLIEAADSPDQLRWLLSELGWTPASIPHPLADLASAGSDLVNVIDTDADITTVQQSLAAVGSLLAAINEISQAPDAAFPSGVDVAAFKASIGPDLLDYLLVEHLLRHHYGIGGLLLLTGFIRLVPQPASGLRQPYLRRQVNWNALADVLRDPAAGFREAFDWNSAAPQLTAAVGTFGTLLERYGLAFTYFRPVGDLLTFITSGDDPASYDEFGIDVAWDTATTEEPGFRAGLQLLVLPATPSRSAAIGFLPYLTQSSATQIPIADGLTLSADGNADLTKGMALIFAPGQPLDVRTGFLGGTAGQVADARLTLAYTPPADNPDLVLLGTEDGSHLSIRGLSVTSAVQLIGAGKVDVSVQADLVRATVAVRPDADGTDSFMADLLGPDGVTAELSPGFRISNTTGFHLTGSGGLDGRFPVDVEIGPISVQSISIALKPAEQGVDFEVGATADGELGPFAIVVEGVGFVLQARFPDPPVGNLGPVDVSFGFLAPTGIGLSIDADILNGGGFIGYDPNSGRYSGVLELQAEQVGITALGMIDTRLPGGAPGYALLVALDATFPAVQIGFGFALVGIGGLLALNRRVDVDVLRSRVAAGTAGRVLAMQDPVRDAPAVLVDLDTVFPVAAGITVVGPTAQLTWADLVHLDVGVFIELPGPSRVVMLGSAYAEIARDGQTYLAIRIDILGVIDLRAETAAFDAALIDSHLMGMLDLTGGAAFRLSWGAQPYAVLSLGGFHPSYDPAPLTFPASLTRIAMVHGKPTDEVYLRFEGYFAITSNTLQFGASVEAAINSGDWAIHGFLGFDALIQRVPFHFAIDIRASVSVSYHGHDLASLTLTGALTGPGPVVLRAKVCIELLFFDVCFSHTFELGSATPPPEPVAPDLLDVLHAELTDPARLRAAGGPDPFVRRRPLDPALTTPVVAPMGTLVWEQPRAPLDLLLTRVGGTPLPAPAQVHASSPASSAAASDWFAPGQFLDLSDDQALTRPGYELLSSGLRLAGAGSKDGPSAPTTLSTRQIRLPAAPEVHRPPLAFPTWILTTTRAAAAPAIEVEVERWVLSTPAGDQLDLTGAQARQLAALAPGARAVPETDRIAALAF